MELFTCLLQDNLEFSELYHFRKIYLVGGDNFKYSKKCKLV